jgi:hypothetical protein
LSLCVSRLSDLSGLLSLTNMVSAGHQDFDRSPEWSGFNFELQISFD